MVTVREIYADRRLAAIGAVYVELDLRAGVSKLYRHDVAFLRVELRTAQRRGGAISAPHVGAPSFEAQIDNQRHVLRRRVFRS